jgi:antitoxin component YwqK of YwqJK toxin-antitoxin module
MSFIGSLFGGKWGSSEKEIDYNYYFNKIYTDNNIDPKLYNFVYGQDESVLPFVVENKEDLIRFVEINKRSKKLGRIIDRYIYLIYINDNFPIDVLEVHKFSIYDDLLKKFGKIHSKIKKDKNPVGPLMINWRPKWVQNYIYDGQEVEYKKFYERQYIGDNYIIYQFWDIYGELISYHTIRSDGKYLNARFEMYDTGKVKLISNYDDDGNKNGLQLKWYYPGNIKKYEINYKNGKLNGEYKEWYENGQPKIKGNYKDGLEGIYMSWHINSQPMIESNYKDGQPEGIYMSWYENGYSNIKAYYDRENPHTYMSWYENGKIKIKTKTLGEGVYIGEYEERYEIGNLKSKYFYNLEGFTDMNPHPFEEYDENGMLKIKGKCIRDYKSIKYVGEVRTWKYGNLGHYLYSIENFNINGELDGSVTLFYENGRIHIKDNYKNGLRNGVFRSFRNNSQNSKIVVATYKNDERDGEYRFYYDNEGNTLNSVSNFKDGELNGLSIEYSEDGTKLSEEYYIDGEPLEVPEMDDVEDTKRTNKHV